MGMDADSSLQTTEREREQTATIQLFFSTFLFGVSFIGQKIAMTQGIGPITYTACRFFVSTVLLVTFQPLIRHYFHSKIEIECAPEESNRRQIIPEVIKWGSMCGLASFGGSNLQQIGLESVSAGKAAFITGMYVIFVPIVELLLPGFGMHLNRRIWVSASISLLGMYFLSGFSVSVDFSNTKDFFSGEMIVFISMLFWVGAIISADVGTKRGVDGVSFTVVEFSVSTVLSITLALIFERDSFVAPFTGIRAAWQMILLVGFTEGVSFLFATLGQMYTAPSKAALIFSLESVAAAIGAYFVLGEILSYTELFGCFLMLSAAVLCTYEPEASPEEEEELIKHDNETPLDDSDEDESPKVSLKTSLAANKVLYSSLGTADFEYGKV